MSAATGEKTERTKRVIGRQEKVTLKFHFLPYHLYKDQYNVTPGGVLRYMSDKFFKLMFMLTQKYGKVDGGM